MTIPPEQGEVVAFLRAATGAEPAETHISVLFVGTDAVLKLRKAIRLEFLDFTSLDARRRYARRELELNTAAAPGLYRDVLAVRRKPDGSLALGAADADDGEAVDWIVRMARIPAEDFIEHRAECGELTPALLDAIADAVAAYHAALPAAPVADPAETMRGVIEQNASSARGAGLAEAPVGAWRDDALRHWHALRGWIEARNRAGFVRRAHGDLHLGNMCLWHGRPAPFDALEFDEALATIDLGYDLAFLLMDLDQRVGRAQANRVFNRYVARTGDAGLVRGLPLFLSLRALIRAHVEARRQRTDLAGRYVRAAEAYLRPSRALVIAMGGLPGTGKSTLARAVAPTLGPAPGALILRSDEIRKRRFGSAPEQKLPQEAYAERVSRAVMTALFGDTASAAGAGHAVIADATCLDPADRREAAVAAEQARVPFLGFWLDAPMAELERRIAARSNDASDATIAVLHAAARAAPAGIELDAGWRRIDATSAQAAGREIQDALAAILAADRGAAPNSGGD